MNCFDWCATSSSLAPPPGRHDHQLLASTKNCCATLIAIHPRCYPTKKRRRCFLEKRNIKGREFLHQLCFYNRPVSSVAKHTVIGARSLGFDSRAGQIGRCVVNSCDASSELCCPGAKSRRWVAPLETYFGVIPRV